MKTLILIALSLLTACSAQKAETELTVSKSFITNGTSSGVMIIHGENLANGRAFTFPLIDGNEKKVQLELGNWRFAAIAWDGTTSPLTGSTFCAIKVVNISGKTTVDLNVDVATCESDAFKEAYSMKNLLVKSCDILRDYDKTSDSFTTITSDTYCDENNTAKADFLKSSLKYYRVYPIDTLGTTAETEITSIVSNCKLQTTSDVYSRIKLPTRKFPFLIKMYKTFEDCQDSTEKNADFRFGSGLEAGDSKFDHHYSVDSSLPTNARLFLPSSITKRGYSPFMSMIPRVLCPTGDCFQGLTLDKYYVDWKDESKYRTVFTNVTANACDPLTSSTYFNATDCKVEKGNLKVKITRNEFMCQGQGRFLGQSQSIAHVYARNNKLFMLKSTAGVTPTYNIIIYNDKGVILKDVPLPNTSQYGKIAVDSNETVYVTADLGKVHIYRIVNGQYTLSDVLTNIVANNIEVTLNGAFLIYDQGGTSVFSYNVSSKTVIDDETGLQGAPIKIQLRGGDLYVVDNNTRFWKMTVNTSTGGLGSFISPLFDDNRLRNFTIIGSKMIYFGFFSGGNDHKKIHYVNTSNGVLTVGDGYPHEYSDTDITSDDNGTLYYPLSTGELRIYKMIGSVLQPISTHTGVCEDDLTITAESGVRTKTLNLKSTAGNSVFNIVNSLYEILGYSQINNIEKARFIFESLNNNNDDDESKSGGELRKVQQMLSPNGLAGLLSEYANCSDVYNHVSSLPEKKLRKDLKLQNRFDAEELEGTLDITIPANTARIDPFICNDTAIQTSQCNDPYNLILNLAITEGNRTEKMIMKLSCGKKLGTLESYEIDGIKTNHAFTMWNTTDRTAARFEKYTYDTLEPSEFSASIYKVVKTSSDSFWARDVHYRKQANSSEGSVREMQKDSSNIFMSQYKFSPNIVYSDLSSSDILDNTTFTGVTAKECMDKSNTLLSFGGNPLSCTFTPPTQVQAPSVPGLDFSIESLITVDSTYHPIKTKFDINP